MLVITSQNKPSCWKATPLDKSGKQFKYVCYKLSSPKLAFLLLEIQILTVKYVYYKLSSPKLAFLFLEIQIYYLWPQFEFRPRVWEEAYEPKQIYL